MLGELFSSGCAWQPYPDSIEGSGFLHKKNASAGQVDLDKPVAIYPESRYHRLYESLAGFHLYMETIAYERSTIEVKQPESGPLDFQVMIIIPRHWSNTSCFQTRMWYFTPPCSAPLRIQEPPPDKIRRIDGLSIPIPQVIGRLLGEIPDSWNMFVTDP